MKEKRNIAMLSLGILSIIFIIIGATYAYFQAQTEGEANTDVSITTDTTDTLTFKASNTIEIIADQENFKEGMDNLSGTANLNAHLIANSTNHTASYRYNVYLDITKNNFVYTNVSTPELVLVIKNPNEKYESATNLKIGKTTTVNLNGEQVSGYDITTKIGIIEISLDYLISASPVTNGIADQNWEISVVFVNLGEEQNRNTGKNFQAKLSIQSEKINVLDLGSISSYYKTSTYKDQIKEVKFVNNIVEEELDSVGEYANWDLSSTKDGSIMGWLKKEYEDETAPYTLYIGSNLKEGEKIIVRSFIYAFYSMKNLEKVDLNLDILDTSNLNDTSNMFYGCSNLTTITGIENLNVSNVMNMSFMFHNCISLAELNLNNWEISNVTNMNGMFLSASSLSTIGEIKNWNTSNVTNMSAMFSNASSLTKLDLSNWNTQNVTNMSNMFKEANNLTTIDLSNWNTHNVTDMSHMFSGTNGSNTSKLATITGIESFDTGNVTNMKDMFNSNDGLKELDLSEWNTSNVTDMNGMFWASHTVTKLNLSGWDTSNVKDMSDMFAATTNLTSIDMRRATFSQVEKYSYMFYNTNLELKVTISGDAKGWFLDHNVLAESKLNEI